MSYKRMKEEEARLEAEVAELHRKAETVDAEEDQRHGKGKRSDEWRLICAGHNLLKLCKAYRQGLVKPGFADDITGVELSVAAISHPFRSQYQSPQFLLNTSCVASQVRVKSLRGQTSRNRTAKIFLITQTNR